MEQGGGSGLRVPRETDLVPLASCTKLREVGWLAPPSVPQESSGFWEHREENIRAILRVSSSGKLGGRESGLGRQGLWARAPLVVSLLSWRERHQLD